MEYTVFNGKSYAMGWGEEGLSPAKKLIQERALREDLENESFFSSVADLVALKDSDDSPMETLVRSKFEFDDGWCFNVSERLLYGEDIVHNQGSVGSCVGAGGGLAIAAKASQEILLEGDLEEPFSGHPMPFTGYHYGAGRCKNLWDGEKFRGSNSRGDGSYCSVQIWAYKTTGILPCSDVQNSSPFPQSSDVRSWGNNRRGELNKYLEVGQAYLMKNSVTVKTADDAKNTLCVLKQPCHICSSWGFKPVTGRPDDKYGVVIHRRSGSWAHNMTVYGVISIKGTWFVVIKNSWGATAHPDPGAGLPRGCFVIPLDLFASWIRQAECMSIGELQLPQGELEWPI